MRKKISKPHGRTRAAAKQFRRELTDHHGRRVVFNHPNQIKRKINQLTGLRKRNKLTPEGAAYLSRLIKAFQK